MKVYISVDMEGIAGISHRDLVLRGKDGYPEGVALMTAEANAAIDGAYAGGASEVTVNDSHGDMYNLTRTALDPRARLIQGRKPMGMVQGAGPDRGFGVAVFVGYHSRAGNGGTLAHTYQGGGPVEVRLNGRPAGEAEVNAACLAQWGIPIGLVSGDDVLAAEIAESLPWAERVIVKEAVAQWAADSLHPSVACDLLRTGAERAVRRAIAAELGFPAASGPVLIEMDFHQVAQAELTELIPTVERVGVRSIRITGPNAVTAYRTMKAVLLVSSVAA